MAINWGGTVIYYNGAPVSWDYAQTLIAHGARGSDFDVRKGESVKDPRYIKIPSNFYSYASMVENAFNASNNTVSREHKEAEEKKEKEKQELKELIAYYYQRNETNVADA